MGLKVKVVNGRLIDTSGPTATDNGHAADAGKPVAPRPVPENFPAELRERPQWVGWKYAPVKRNWTKVPFQARNPRRKASTTDPATWATFEEAWAAYLDPANRLDGIGYVFSEDDPYTGVDLDKCLGPDGEVLGWARPHLGRLTGYGEVSPSGRGVKVIVRGALPADSKHKRGGLGDERAGAVEMYDRGRFFTMTGHRLDDAHAEIEDRAAELAAVYAEVFAPKTEDGPTNEKTRAAPATDAGGRKVLVVSKCDGPEDLDDDELIEKARGAKNGAQFRLLFDHGDASRYPSQSEADLALCGLIAFYTGNDASRVDRIFRRSKLFDPKWDQRRGAQTYGQRTVAKALQGRTEFYTGRVQDPETNGQAATGLDAGLAKRPRTDLGNAERLVARHGAEFRYCHPWGKGLVWDGRRWALDNTAAMRRLAKKAVRSILREAATVEDEARRKEHVRWSLVSENRARIDAMLSLAAAEEGIPILADDMDRDPWLFNCRNGTIDLRTGTLRPHRRDDLLTKLCPWDYDPDAPCPHWESTLRLFFNDIAELIDYWRRICGYAMAGVIRDHVMPLAYGTGANGKSTILGALIDAFGHDYAMKCPPDLLMAKKTDSHPTDRADLFGKRLVVAIETEAGRRLAETMVKELTGGDRIRARRMREDFWEFSPTHTLIMATNHKPVIRGTDNGIWRRLRLVPFTVAVAGDRDDKGMPEKLRAEAPGILAWCVRGCLDWQAHGLKEPREVTAATGGYRKEQDLVGAYLDQCTVCLPGVKVRAGALYAHYRQWAEAGNEFVMTQSAFGTAMEERGVEKCRSGGIWYQGIALRQDDGPREEGTIP
jgi:putative DNA primase/helicase